MELKQTTVEKLQKFGDYLNGIDDVRERNDAGFNQPDKMRWPHIRNHGAMMGVVLRKYRRQLSGAFGVEEFDSVFSDVQQNVPAGPTITPTETLSQYGKQIEMRANFIPARVFDSYKDLCKFKFFMWWDPVKRCWFVPAKNMDGFNLDAFSLAVADLEIEIEPVKRLADVEIPRARPKNANEAEAMIRSGLFNGVLIRYRHDRKFEIRFGFHPKLVEIFSNKLGIISGITEYNPDTKARETFSLPLVEEAILKMRELIPGIDIFEDAMDVAREEYKKTQALLAEQIPEVRKYLAPGFALRPYQNEAVLRIVKEAGRQMLALDMGLGKTCCTLSYVAGWGRRAVIVAPKTVRAQWIAEAKKFFPSVFNDLNSFELTPRSKNINLLGARLVTLNYENVDKFMPYFKDAGFDTLVVDESQMIKNPNSVRAQAVAELAELVPFRIMLTGTAIKNKREEIFSQIQLVNEDLFASKTDVKRMSIGGLWNYIQPYYFQRSKFDVAKDLPEKITQIMELPAEDEVYDIDPANPPSFEEISGIKARIAKDKASTTVAFIREIIQQSETGILVFTDSVEAAQAIRSELGDDTAVLHHGQMRDDDRERVKLDWQAGILKQQVFVTTRQSLAVGANMTRAEYVIFNDLPWTAADVAQAEARAHRIGSRNTVNVYWISITGNVWDKKLSSIIMQKYELAKKVNEGKQITPEEREWMGKPVSWSDLFTSRKKS